MQTSQKQEILPSQEKQVLIFSFFLSVRFFQFLDI